MRVLSNLAAGAALLILANCSYIPYLDDVPPPANATERCPDLTPLTNGDGASVLNKLVEWKHMYLECQAKVDALRSLN